MKSRHILLDVTSLPMRPSGGSLALKYTAVTNVINLAIHLENGQRMYYTESNARQIATTPPQTILTAFFKFCQIDSFAEILLYLEVPTYYTWKSLEKPKMWGKCTQGKKVQGQLNIRQGLPLAECTQCIIRMRNAFTLDCYCTLLKGQHALQT